MAEVLRGKLVQNHRCLYLNSAPMVAGMGSYLAAAGVDVTQETARGSLVFSSRANASGGWPLRDRPHDGSAAGGGHPGSADKGYAGLWATGDMTWELGPERDFSKLLEYEWRLEEFMRAHPALSGICQYHTTRCRARRCGMRW